MAIVDLTGISHVESVTLRSFGGIWEVGHAWQPSNSTLGARTPCVYLGTSLASSCSWPGRDLATNQVVYFGVSASVEVTEIVKMSRFVMAVPARLVLSFEDEWQSRLALGDLDIAPSKIAVG